MFIKIMYFYWLPKGRILNMIILLRLPFTVLHFWQWTDMLIFVCCCVCVGGGGAGGVSGVGLYLGRRL